MVDGNREIGDNKEEWLAFLQMGRPHDHRIHTAGWGGNFHLKVGGVGEGEKAVRMLATL